jgi:hypothetical protein
MRRGDWQEHEVHALLIALDMGVAGEALNGVCPGRSSRAVQNKAYQLRKFYTIKSRQGRPWVREGQKHFDDQYVTVRASHHGWHRRPDLDGDRHDAWMTPAGCVVVMPKRRVPMLLQRTYDDE